MLRRAFVALVVLSACKSSGPAKSTAADAAPAKPAPPPDAAPPPLGARVTVTMKGGPYAQPTPLELEAVARRSDDGKQFALVLGTEGHVACPSAANPPPKTMTDRDLILMFLFSGDPPIAPTRIAAGEGLQFQWATSSAGGGIMVGPSVTFRTVTGTITGTIDVSGPMADDMRVTGDFAVRECHPDGGQAPPEKH